jgi:UDP-N-acetylglucosamine 2-epimerase (non-hydrolysing)
MSDPKIRVLSIFGTRPEAVKMAPVVQLLAKRPEIQSRVCVTAQHREMLDQVLNLFDIQTDYDLNLMRHDQSLAELTAGVFSNLDPVLRELKPDWILVQGDTTTVMAASLLAYYHRVRVGHVEAGLRTSDKWQPFPEEINRRIAGVVADLHFAPTTWARDNLYDLSSGPLTDVPDDRKIILVTAHRRENFGEPMVRIFSALKQLAETNVEKIVLIYPVHLNPNVHNLAHKMLGEVSNIHLIPPLEYLPMVHLMEKAVLVLTDSVCRKRHQH